MSLRVTWSIRDDRSGELVAMRTSIVDPIFCPGMKLDPYLTALGVAQDVERALIGYLKPTQLTTPEPDPEQTDLFGKGAQ